MTANPLPKPGETLVYDRARDPATCLNVLPPKVWLQCDGETSVAGIAVGEDKRAAAIVAPTPAHASCVSHRSVTPRAARHILARRSKWLAFVFEVSDRSAQRQTSRLFP